MRTAEHNYLHHLNNHHHCFSAVLFFLKGGIMTILNIYFLIGFLAGWFLSGLVLLFLQDIDIIEIRLKK